MTRTLVALLALLAAPLTAAERIPFTVSETAGLRRFGYPVEATLKLPSPAAPGTPFRLLAGGKNPVAAQFTPGDGVVTVDFALSCGPRERFEYVVEYGEGVSPPEAGKDGVSAKVADGQIRVSGGGGLTYVVPEDGKGLLASVAGGKTEYLRPGSAGLAVAPPGKEPIPFVAKSAKVIRQGPFAAAVRLEGDGSTATLTFPRSKSWVRVDWELAEAAGPLTADLNLSVTGPPTLIDFGAASMVYTALKPGETASLLGEKAGCRVLAGKDGAKVPTLAEFAGPAEGWAHVMDKTRCTAAGLVEFRDGASIRADADGRLRLAVPTARRLTFYLHFVPAPVHVGALTSPQSMLAPLAVTTAKAE